MFKKLADIEASPSVNFFGRVVQIKPARQTRGTDWVMSLLVVDDSLINDANRGVALINNGAGLDGLMVMIFKPHPSQFPKVQAIGDIVQFRHFRVQEQRVEVVVIFTYFFFLA